MIPTRLGLSLLAIAGTFYALAWLTRIGWLYIAPPLILAILLLNLMLPPLNVRALSAERRFKNRKDGEQVDIFEDDILVMETRLSNRSLLPKIALTLREVFPCAPPGKEEYGYFIGALSPRRTSALTYGITCHRRGVYSFPPLRVESSAPFGFFRAVRSLEAPMEVTVYPKVLPIDVAVNQGTLQGDSPRFGRPTFTGEVRSSREFQQSDELRHIHWKNSARSGRLMVKQFDQTPRGELRIAFNPGVNLGRGRETTLEYAIKIAASLACYSFNDGRRFRMWPGGTEADLTTWHNVLEHLARIQAEPQPSVSELLRHRNPQGISIVAISAADQDAFQQLLRLQYPQGIVVVMMEGFDSREDVQVRHEISNQGLTVVPCKVNELSKALQALGKILETQDASVAMGRR